MSPTDDPGRLARLQQLCDDLDTLQKEVRDLCHTATEGVVKAHQEEQIQAAADRVAKRTRSLRTRVRNLQ